MTPTVIIHIDEDGIDTIISDVPVTVLNVDERAPSDRVYRRKVEAVGQEFIAAVIGDCMVGHFDDGSPAQARAQTLVNGGKPKLEIVE